MISIPLQSFIRRNTDGLHVVHHHSDIMNSTEFFRFSDVFSPVIINSYDIGSPGHLVDIIMKELSERKKNVILPRGRHERWLYKK